MAIAGIDVGGTFTDVFIRDRERNTWVVHKAPSTPPDFSRGFMAGLQQALAKAEVSPAQVERLVHGTTVATNCILTRQGARLGLMMTEGFRDVLYIGVGWRPRMYDLDMDPVEPLFLAPRRRSLGVRERMDAEGQVVVPLDEEHLKDVAHRLVQEQGAEVLVVCYLHAYANPDHERRTREILQPLYPDVDITLSSDVLPRRREYRRLVVSGFDGYVKPVVTNYLRGLQRELGEAGVAGPLHVMQSHGGVGGVGNIIERPVGTVLSGLAAGVIGAANVGASAGFPDCISLDMGGTSTDVALIRGGRALISNDGSFADYPLNIPMIDVQTIGAGGSSVAYVDEGGALKVGPESAGADPGPACYGRGGTEPTVTDSSFVLGYLNPETFAGNLNLDIERSRQVIEQKIAQPLGLGLLEAALGIQAIVNNNMAQTLRLVSIKRGHDPRHFALVAFGGAGPLSAGKLAEAASIGKILIPTAPGVLSAMGSDAGAHTARSHDEFRGGRRRREPDAFASAFRGTRPVVPRQDARRRRRPGGHEDRISNGDALHRAIPRTRSGDLAGGCKRHRRRHPDVSRRPPARLQPLRPERAHGIRHPAQRALQGIRGDNTARRKQGPSRRGTIAPPPQGLPGQHRWSRERARLPARRAARGIHLDGAGDHRTGRHHHTGLPPATTPALTATGISSSTCQ